MTNFAPATVTLEALRAAEPPSFIERDPFKLKQYYVTEFERITGRVLYPSQTEMFVIEVMAYAKAIMGEAIQTAFLQNRAVWAEGAHLDEIGANVSTYRLTAQSAKATLRVSLNSVQSFDVLIPSGSMFAAGTVHFLSGEAVFIPAGQSHVDITVEAEAPGTLANDILPGQINTLLSSIGVAVTVSNLDASSGGTDRENDERYRERVCNAFERVSRAGPRAGYVEHVKAVSPVIVDVSVIKPQPGYIEITPLMVDGVSTDETDAAILDYLDPETLIPMGDYVSIVKAVDVAKDLTIAARVENPSAGLAARIEAVAREAFRPWSLSLGARLAPSVLIAAVKALPEVVDVAVAGLAYEDLAATRFATINSLVVNLLDGSDE